jgi:hypothetical protein
LRRLWTLYKRVAKEHGTDSRRDLVLLQDAFYSGARGVLKVLEHMLRHGKQEELNEAIRRHGRQIDRIRGRRPVRRQ